MEEAISSSEITNISQVIIDTINNLLNSLFSSIDNSVYGTLDELTFIGTDILDDSLFSKIFGHGSNNGLLIIANSLLVAVCLYYCFKLIYSHFTGISIERPYQFVFKLLIFAIFINFSYFICEFFIYFTDLLSSLIIQIGGSILNKEISFSALVEGLNSVITIDSASINVFSFDGILRSIISFSFVSLLFTYSLRYIMIKVLILLMPFAFLTLINASTSWFFKAWLKIFLSLLFIQPFISIVLLIASSLDFSSSDILSKILCIGSLYALLKANSYVQHFIGGISAEVSQGFRLMKGQVR